MDFHGRATPMISKILCKGLEPYFPMFVEEAMWGQDGAVIFRFSAFLDLLLFEP